MEGDKAGGHGGGHPGGAGIGGGPLQQYRQVLCSTGVIGLV